MANNDIDKEIRNAVLKKVSTAINKGFNQEYVETIRDRIVKRTQLGIGVDPETGASQRLKPLADVTKKVRKNQARVIGIKGGGKIVYTDGTEEKGLSRKSRKTRKESFKAFFGDVKLAKTTTPSKSNLTATGQLLKSLTVIKIKIRNAVAFKITVADRRGRDMFGNPSKIGNKQLVEYLKEQGRTFLGLTKSQRNQIAKEIRQILKKFL